MKNCFRILKLLTKKGKKNGLPISLLIGISVFRSQKFLFKMKIRLTHFAAENSTFYSSTAKLKAKPITYFSRSSCLYLPIPSSLSSLPLRLQLLSSLSCSQRWPRGCSQNPLAILSEHQSLFQ